MSDTTPPDALPGTPRRDASQQAALTLLDTAVTRTLADYADVVEAWRAGTPKTWGYLAGRAVGNARRTAGRNLTDGERRYVWARLWEALQQR